MEACLYVFLFIILLGLFTAATSMLVFKVIDFVLRDRD
jgi:hypothetical protein